MIPDQASCRKGLWVIGHALSSQDGFGHDGHGESCLRCWQAPDCIQITMQQIGETVLPAAGVTRLQPVYTEEN